MRLIVALLLFCLLFPANLMAQPDADMNIYPQSVATVNDISAGLVNPAALAPEYVIGFRYLHAFPDSTFKGDDGFIFGMRGVLVSAQWLKHSNGIFRRKYVVAGGARMFPDFYWGLSYSWFGGKSESYRDKRIWKSGILYRPLPVLSLGLVVDDINRPVIDFRRFERLYTMGLGLRPFGEKLTISSDASLREDSPLEKMQFNFKIEALPKAGVSLAAAYRTDGLIQAGIAFAIEQSSIGFSSGFHESDFSGGTIYYNQGPVASARTSPYHKKIGRLKINRNLSHEPRERSLFGQRPISFLELLQVVRQASADRKIGSLLLDIESFPLGFASAWELRRALADFRKTGKKVIAYLHSAGNKEYYIASVSDEIYMPPVAALELCGLRAELLHLKGTLDKLGLEAEFMSTGPFKTAGEILTRETISEAESIQINALLDDFFDIMVSDIAAGRALTEYRVEEIIDNGPYGANRAFTEGLISGLIYPDELTDKKDLYFGSNSGFVDLIGRDEPPKATNYWGDPLRIAVINATGEMTGRKNSQNPLFGNTMGQETIAKAIKAAADDKRVAAVVLRVDSPGGEAETADAIYHELEKLKEKKPLVVSMADVCASGGYYIGCIGDEIVVPSPCVTGSIGVVVGKIVNRGLYQKIGANKTIIKRGRHADIRSSWRKLDDAERELVLNEMNWLYDEFIAKVSRWRQMTPQRVDSLGQGRVWSGRKAVSAGLATREGGLLDALTLAESLARPRPGQPIEYDVYPRYGFKLSFGVGSFERDLAAIGIDRLALPIRLSLADDNPTFYRMPFDINIK